MPVTYTNRKGRTYYLCRGVTKAGKPRYYFAREPKDEPVEEIPEGYSISESVNGHVSLVKDRPRQLLPEEIAAVKVAVQRHAEASNYRVGVTHDRIVVYERVGDSPDEVEAKLKEVGLLVPGRTVQLREALERRARFTPVLRLILVDDEGRIFTARRRRQLDGSDHWVEVGAIGSVGELAQRLIPQLGRRPLC